MSTELISGLLLPRQKSGPQTTSESEIGLAAAHRRIGSQRIYLWQSVRTSFPLWLADEVALITALALGSGLGLVLGRPSTSAEVTLAIVLSLGLLISNFVLGLYPGVGLGPAAELRLCTTSATVVFGICFLSTAFRDGLWAAPATLLVYSWVAAVLLLPTLRRVARRVAAKTTWWGHPLIILGGDAEGAFAYRTLMATPEQGLRPVGVLDDLHHHWATSQDADPDWYLGPLSDAGQIAAQKGVFWGLVSMTRHADDDFAQVIDRYAAALPHLLILTNFGSSPRLWRGAFECGNLTGVRIDEGLLLPLPRLIKRATDVLLTLVGGVVIMPLLAVIVCAVWFSSPGPVFYSQERIGLGGRRFRAWKFRTMVRNADQFLATYLRNHPEMEAEWKRDHKLKNDPRVTRIGRILRKTSLDELPQLWNVLKGEMSLVGPRPIVQSEIHKYGAAYRLYERVVPGITGLWQISGRNNTTYEKRVELDMFYARNWSIWFDMQILLGTIDVVLHCRGAY